MADSKNRGPLATDASLPLGHVCSGWLRPHQGSESSRGPSLDGKEDAGRQPEKGSGTGPGGAAAASATAAALVSCFVTSILESPIELFRHRLQVSWSSQTTNALGHPQLVCACQTQLVCACQTQKKAVL